MNCETVREMLWAYLEQELTAEETVNIEEHLKNCDDCRKELELQKEIMDSLQNIPDEELPEGYHRELMQKLQAETKVVPFPVKKKKQPMYKQWGMIAAAVLVVVAAGGMNGMLEMRESQNAAIEEMKMEDAAEPMAASMEDGIAVAAEKEKDNGFDYRKMNAPAAGADVASLTAEETTAAYDTDAAEAVEENAINTDQFSMVRSADVRVMDAAVLAAEDISSVKAELQALIAEMGGYEEAAADENTVVAVIPVEAMEAFTEKLEGLGKLEWTQKTKLEAGVEYKTVEIQLK